MTATLIISALTTTTATASKLETATSVLEKLNEMLTIKNMPYPIIRKAIRLQKKIINNLS